MKGLLVTKPVRIIGQPNCILEITEGPISININGSYENEVVKFSQIKIVFDICEAEKSIITNFKGESSKFTVLFRLYPGSLLEVEDCDISCNKDTSIPISKHKLICFQLMYCKYSGKNNTENNLNTNIISPTILTIISSRIEKFYQTIRSAENCIINIEKSFINKNIGKSLCILNPLILKVHGSIFEGNGDNAIHLKFVKDDNLLNDNRQIFFKNNEFCYNFGTGVYIDGIENFMFDLDISIESNIFKKNKGDGVFMLDLSVKSFVLKENQFLSGKSNGLNLNKVYQKNSLTNNISNCLTSTSTILELPLIEITENEFIENDGFGIFMNDSKARIISNNLFRNRGCGILLINLNNFSVNNNNVENKIQTSQNNNSLDNNSSLINSNGTCFLQKNSFLKNGGSGLMLINYNYFTYISECHFKENIEFGIKLEIDNSVTHLINNQNNIQENHIQNNNLISNEKIKLFKNSDNSKMPKETNLFLVNTTIVNNMKSGIFLNNCFIFLENTIISDNLDYSFYLPIEEFRFCYKQSKNSENNLINGNVGGPWGELHISNNTLCNGCTSSSTKIKKKYIQSLTSGNNNNNNSGNFNGNDKLMNNNQDPIVKSNKIVNEKEKENCVIY